ncbi:MAG: hypothetical protein M1821_000813 [Bathelium mastoideum]|nr:MAG: hypothetical protein M1821_000813 [Bathelium mastoideum]
MPSLAATVKVINATGAKIVPTKVLEYWLFSDHTGLQDDDDQAENGFVETEHWT